MAYEPKICRENLQYMPDQILQGCNFAICWEKKFRKYLYIAFKSILLETSESAQKDHAKIFQKLCS